MLTSRLLEYLDQFEDESHVGKLDDTIYHSCGDDDSELEEDTIESQAQDTLNVKFTDSQDYMNIPGNSIIKNHVRMPFRTPRFENSTTPQNTTNQNSFQKAQNQTQNQMFELFNNFLKFNGQYHNNAPYNQQFQNYRPGQFSNYQYQGTSNHAPTESLTLEEIQLKVGTSSERLLIKKHPYLCSLSNMGLTVPKDLRQVRDFDLIRAVCRWKVQTKFQSPHKDSLLYAIGKVQNISEVESETGTLVVKLFNAIDSGYEAGIKTVSTTQIDQWWSEFVYQENAFGPAHRVGQHVRSRQSGNQATCNKFNMPKGCQASNCFYQHQCSICIKNGKIAKHPAYKCQEVWEFV